MQIKANTPEEYISLLPEERKNPVSTLRKVILDNIPTGFSETISYGTIGYVVPHSIYPKGYHVDPKLPLPFIALASQKHFIALYHMGLYSDKNLLQWFLKEYSIESKTKLDMGKSCIRFKKMGNIPFKLIGELVSRITVKDWIGMYEKNHISKYL